MGLFSDKIEQGSTLPSCFRSHAILKRYPFQGVFSATSELFLVTSLLKMALKHRAEMLSSVAKCREAVVCLMVKVHGSDELHLAGRDSAVRHELRVQNQHPHLISRKGESTHLSLRLFHQVFS